MIMALFFAIVLFAGCDTVHEWPEEGKEVDPTLLSVEINVNCVIEMQVANVISKAAPALDQEEEISEKYDRRFIVEIRNNEYDDKLVETHTITREADDTSPLNIRTTLNTRKYKLIVWMDYVLKGTTGDLYYYTGNGEDLKAIHVPSMNKYVAGTDYKDAQCFLTNLDLTPYVNQWFAEINIDAPLDRPLAKVTFLASDFVEYAESLGYSGNLDELARNMTIEFSYNGYLPTGYNAISGRLNDSEVGYKFNHNIIYPAELDGKTYTLVGSDYVFVNGESSSVTISATIQTKEGNFVNEAVNIVVPTYRGKETIVIYKFFTKEYVPGVGIDPGFDGEFNVYV